MKDKDLEFVKDIIKIAQYLQWETKAGKSNAATLIDRIHAGEYGCPEGIWVQAKFLVARLKRRLEKKSWIEIQAMKITKFAKPVEAFFPYQISIKRKPEPKE